MLRTSPLFLLALCLVACGGSGGGDRHTVVGCRDPGPEVIGAAAAKWVTLVSPRPGRFLNPVGTDSAFPEASTQPLQDRGKLFLYPKDSAGRTVIHQRLVQGGEVPTVLLANHGVRRLDDENAVVRLGGHFVGGPENGTAVPTQAFYFRCDNAEWKLTRNEVEHGS